MGKPKKRKAVRKVEQDKPKGMLPEDALRRDIKDIYHDVIELISVHERIISKIEMVRESHYIGMLESGIRKYVDLLPGLSIVLKKRADGVTEIQRRYIIAFRDLLVRARNGEETPEGEIPAEQAGHARGNKPSREADRDHQGTPETVQ